MLVLWSALGRLTWVIPNPMVNFHYSHQDSQDSHPKPDDQFPKDLSSWDLLRVLWSALGRSTWVRIASLMSAVALYTSWDLLVVLWSALGRSTWLIKPPHQAWPWAILLCRTILGAIYFVLYSLD